MRDGSTARASGQRQPKDVMAVRATVPLSVGNCIYFEVLIVAAACRSSAKHTHTRAPRNTTTSALSKGSKANTRNRSLSTPHTRPEPGALQAPCSVTVGLSTKRSGSLLYHPGADQTSYGYCGADGARRTQGVSQQFGEMFGAGDVIGCGFDPRCRVHVVLSACKSDARC